MAEVRLRAGPRPGGGSCSRSCGCEGHCLGLRVPPTWLREAPPVRLLRVPGPAPSLAGRLVTLWPALFSAPRSVVRRAASLLSKVVDSLAPSITNVLVQGKQVSVCSHPPGQSRSRSRTSPGRTPASQSDSLRVLGLSRPREHCPRHVYGRSPPQARPGLNGAQSLPRLHLGAAFSAPC